MIRPDGPTLAITFIYCRDLPRAMRFYEDVMGLPLAIDQGWCKIYRLCGAAHLGLVDETRGMHRWAEDKPVQICLRVADVDEAFRVAQGAMASKAGNALMQIGVRAAAGEGGLSVLMRERQALTNALDGIEDRLTLPGADTVAPTGEADALQSRLAGVDARVSADYPEFRALTRPRPLTVAGAQALLSPDEALVLTFVGDNATCVFAVSKTSAGWHRLSLARKALVKVIGGLRDTLDPSGTPAC